MRRGHIPAIFCFEGPPVDTKPSCPAKAGYPVRRDLSLPSSVSGILDRPPSRAMTVGLVAAAIVARMSVAICGNVLGEEFRMSLRSSGLRADCVGLPALWLFPRRFLFAAFRFQPERAAGETGRVEIALRADALEIQHRAQAVRRRLRFHGAGIGLRRCAVGHGLGHDAADQFAVRLLRQPHDLCGRSADIGIADGQGVDIAGFEVGSDRGREVQGVAAAEAAVHALALAQHRVGNLHRAIGRLLAAGRPGAEIDHDRRDAA